MSTGLLPPPDAVDLVTQLKLTIAALPASSGATEDIRSYDLTWILHLVGDAHQPLHASGRYTRQIPNGDGGGNAEQVIPATGETLALMPIGTVFSADMSRLTAPYLTRMASQTWIKESVELAIQYAYAPPISLGNNPVLLSREYETNTGNIARSQAALAAARLANLINNALR